MEQDQQQYQPQPVARPHEPDTQPRKKSKKALAIFLFIIAILILGGSLFFYLGKKGQGDLEATPTPEAIEEIPVEEPTFPTETPASESIDRSEVTISVLNGTGIPKEASYVQGLLKELGYSDIEVGNAKTQDYKTTEVSFNSKLPDTIADEITTTLKKSYETVKTSTSSSQSVDVQIITGLKKGQTAKPQASTIASPIATSTPSPTSSPSPSPTTAP